MRIRSAGHGMVWRGPARLGKARQGYVRRGKRLSERRGEARYGSARCGSARRGVAGRGKATLREMKMKTVIATVEGVSPYSQSKSYEVDKLQGEGPDDYERRTWRNRLHVNDKGQVFIPPMGYKNALAETAKFLSISIPGKGKSTYTKHFEAGVLAVEPAYLGVEGKDVQCERLFVPSDGRPGGGKRVYKYFPVIPADNISGSAVSGRKIADFMGGIRSRISR